MLMISMNVNFWKLNANSHSKNYLEYDFDLLKKNQLQNNIFLSLQKKNNYWSSKWCWKNIFKVYETCYIDNIY